VCRGQAGFRLATAALWLAQPLARTWGRLAARGEALRGLAPALPLAGPARSLPGGTLLLPVDGPRERTAAVVAETLHRTGLRIVAPSDWDQRDVGIVGSALVLGELLTSGSPNGAVQLRVRRRLRVGPAAGVGALTVLAAVFAPGLVPVVVALAAADMARGLWRTGPGLRAALGRAAGGTP